MDNPEENNLSLKNLKLNILARKFFISEKLIKLRNKEFCLMEYFMKNFGKVLSRTQLLEAVWDRNICCATNTVDVHVSGLRKKLRFFTGLNLIKTVHCIGYIFEF